MHATRIVGDTRFRVLRSPDEIEQDVQRIARELHKLAGDHVPVFIALLKGSFVFLSDLMRAYGEPLQIDFLSVTRFDPAIKDPSSVRVLSDLATNIDGRLVVVVEGIRSTGTKVEYVHNFLRLHGAGDVLHCAMVRQIGSSPGVVPLDSWGFETDDREYVVGYGLDLDERYRNLPFIGVIEPEAGATQSG
jgi:hypoxanthine phosphoribosyltransferase